MYCKRHILSLVTVYDCDAVGAALPERKTNAPTGIHGHRPLVLAVSFEFLKPNAWDSNPAGFSDIQGRQQIHCRSEIQAMKLRRATKLRRRLRSARSIVYL